MKIRLFPFQNEIQLSESYVSIFQINNKTLFNKVANSLYTYSIGQQGEEKILLLNEGEIVEFEETVLFLTDLWHFDCNSKKIMTKLFSYIEKNYKLDAELMEGFQQQIRQIQLGIRDITDELPFEVECKEIVTLQDILKMLGIKLAKLDGYSIIERAITIIEIVETFQLYPCIIFCNIKNYLNWYVNIYLDTFLKVILWL